MISIRFTGDEGDEVPVMDLIPKFEKLIAKRCNVELLPTEMHVFDQASLPCLDEGRRRAPRY